jgi:transcription antitermination factor NusG
VSTDWYAIYTRHQHEKSVVQLLQAKGFEVFLPLYAAVHRWKDREKELSLPLFPCYVFLRGGLERRYDIVTTPGMHCFVGAGNQPETIPSEEIEAIRRAVENSIRLEPHPYLKCGDRVRVKSGPMTGVEGTLLRKKSLYRLVLSVDVLRQSVALDIDAAIVEKVGGRFAPVPLSVGEDLARRQSA